jgi:hypothetical protein
MISETNPVDSTVSPHTDFSISAMDPEIKESCEIVMRQTDYDFNTSLLKLKHHNSDIMAIVREWMGENTSIKEASSRTTNQMIFDEFRGYLDAAANTYAQKQDQTKTQPGE